MVWCSSLCHHSVPHVDPIVTRVPCGTVATYSCLHLANQEGQQEELNRTNEGDPGTVDPAVASSLDFGRSHSGNARRGLKTTYGFKRFNWV